MKVLIRGKNQQVNLDRRNFLAKGGEGEIYVKNKTVYKICDPGKMIPEGKFDELSVLTDPHIIRPEDILLDSNNKPTGYTMRYISDSYAVCQLFTKTFKTRNNIQPNQMLDLVRQTQNTLSFVHSKKILCVDFNELNLLASKTFDEIYFIDVNSYQTPHYPATAIMESIRDRHCNGIYSEETDWFSFAIVTFQMLIGIHPYKGKHPRFTDAKTALDERMKHNISIFNPEVSYPKAACLPLNVIPDVYLQWYQAVFDKGLRIKPPKDLVATIAIVTHVKKVSGSNNLEIEELKTFSDNIVRHYWHQGREVVKTTSGVYVDGRLQNNCPEGQPYIGFTPKLSKPIALYKDGGLVGLYDFNHMLGLQLFGSQVMEYDGRLYIQNVGNVIEITLNESNNQILASPLTVGSVSEHSAKFYDGIIIQDLFGTYYGSIFPNSKECRQFKFEELNDYKIVDAKFEKGVLVVVGINQNGQYDRFVFRFSNDWSKYDTRIQKDVVYVGINFTVLDNGICVLLNEDEKLEIFKADEGASGLKIVEDDALQSDMHLTSRGGKVMFFKDKSLYSMKMR